MKINKIVDFDCASRFLDRGRNKNLRPIAGLRSTWVRRDFLRRYIAILYHRTEVVRYYSDGRITVHIDHHYTVTTKKRINTFAPVRIFQRNFIWYIAENVRFIEGMQVNSNVSVLPHAYTTQKSLLDI